ncbi:GntR family transcriptional regulator [Streptomyces sp. NPDC057638]|uniref:GntR family transcriptional regulator n=1 Tax=Streptomyces sp. NPDC057638 TaxID=3346190 RepID=UPI0036A6BD5E
MTAIPAAPSAPADPAQVLQRLHRFGGPLAAGSIAGACRELDEVRRLTREWLPAARRCREDAARSPADTARWNDLIRAAENPSVARGEQKLTHLFVHLAGLRELLRAIAESTPPNSSVAALADRLRGLITTGHYPPGALLPLSGVAATLGTTSPRAQLVIADLLAENVVARRGSGYQVPDPDALTPDALPRHAAGLLRDLITAGVYPPGTPLPYIQSLARALAVRPPVVTAALLILSAEQTVIHHPGQRAQVVTGLRLPSAPPPAHRGDADVPFDAEAADELVRTARRWWHYRKRPGPADLHQCLTGLRDAAEHLLVLAGTGGGSLSRRRDKEDVRELALRTAYLLSAEPPDTADLRVWHTACLATAVSDLLDRTAAFPPLQYAVGA